MPQVIPIQTVPNQSLTVTLDGNLWGISIKTCNGITAVSLRLNGVDLIDDLIAAACAPIIPSPYQESGNFVFLTANNQLPNYTQFNVTQSLFYFSAAELATIRIPPVASSKRVPTVTAASFNQIAQLPLRFSPQGYVEG